MEALINIEKEGIAEEDFAKSWARMQDINDVELEKRNPPIDRSRVRTLSLNPELLEAPQEPSFKKPTADHPAWKIRKTVCGEAECMQTVDSEGTYRVGKVYYLSCLSGKDVAKRENLVYSS